MIKITPNLLQLEKTVLIDQLLARQVAIHTTLLFTQSKSDLKCLRYDQNKYVIAGQGISLRLASLMSQLLRSDSNIFVWVVLGVVVRVGGFTMIIILIFKLDFNITGQLALSLTQNIFLLFMSRTFLSIFICCLHFSASKMSYL